jgi:hypothetical protein
LVRVNDAYGHILPLVPTIQRMRDRGHEVALAAPGDRVTSLSLDGVHVWHYLWAPPANPPALPTTDGGNVTGWLGLTPDEADDLAAKLAKLAGIAEQARAAARAHAARHHEDRG